MSVSGELLQALVAVLAAAAAYAAGRAQASGARRGPVDAVRRQHQRDAYAAFLKAARQYERATRFADLARAAQADNNGLELDRQALLREVVRRRAWISLEPIAETLPVVQLEGPKMLAVYAQEAADAAERLAQVAQTLLPAFAFGDVQKQFEQDTANLHTRITHFTVEARAFLDDSARRRTRRFVLPGPHQ
ncbi:hypothetical protein BJ965_007681 [Streptomyces luteogriseus]|uniref:Secreted protein n=1 Tax=Streptomyces luteogriseus TaxID=68233 RepID=A0A7W7GL95_9ACTN|nr:hypothetical protein [Streptomyces luteogriseus]MBB4717799.1 hypothetical protein [Streptomyces luteogriseus]